MSVKKLFDLDGRVALITGGSRGLGLQMAEALGEMGATVVLTARKKQELINAQARLQGLNVKAFTVVNDLQDSDSIEPMVKGVLNNHEKFSIV